ncbi:uncharacterized protein [Blastocystis hominis]|uniref:Uncharacterized protein n=1 Tax=Blastocystis hominis TaxID=12968 RepID=D8M9U3_BLAHO|nr:uncharacterized protein [Blastocystis hominis]CBK24832.2 unnamed protein product [Blastocystis hominis]|eukprot:XP_012898880.1 uncharacterized protein [Blastocystis hominis]
MRRTVGTIPKTLDMQLEEGNYYEALQLYKSLQSRYETAEKYKESDELLFHGIENMNKHNQVDSFLFALSLRTIWLCCISIP